MRSLFVKIFGVCVFVLIASFSATVFIKLGTFRADSPHTDAFSTLLTVELNEARHAWETGGRPGLEAALERMAATTQASELVFTDSNGTDLLTGADRSKLVAQARNRGRFSSSGGDSRSFARVSVDGRYWYFLHDSAGLFAPQERLRLYFALLCAGLPAWLLVRLLVRPLARLEEAMNRFGNGDLDARAVESSKDEFGRLGRSFNRMADQIRTLLGAERRLLQDISHELRSPLTRMQVSIELGRNQDVPGLTLDRIQREADRLGELVGQLLEVTRAEADPAKARAEVVRVDEVTAHVVESCAIEAQAKGCSLRLHSPGSVTMAGNAELLRRAVENVLRNAIRYAPDHTRVEVDLNTPDNQVKIAVRDYGPGVPVESLPRIFDAFYRSEPDRDRSSGGIGLGLAITRRAVELHRGTVEAFNAHPGLLVEIHLPA